MGLFDNEKQNEPTEPKEIYKPDHEQQAWVNIALGVAMADGDFNELELKRFSQLLAMKEFFRGFHLSELVKHAQLKQTVWGSMLLVDFSCDSVSVENRNTLFAIAVDMLLEDGIASDSDKEALEHLSKRLKIDQPTAKMIVDVVLIRNKGNTTFDF